MSLKDRRLHSATKGGEGVVEKILLNYGSVFLIKDLRGFQNL